MTVKELYNALNERIPQSLSCAWDNDGLMCCPDGSRAARRVLVTLDVTSDAVEYAISGGFDLIVSHHPFIFKGLKSVGEDDHIAAKAIDLIRNGISVMSFHTRLDAVEGGVNDTLAELLGLCHVELLISADGAIGRVGVLPAPMELSDFARLVKARLSAPYVLCAEGGGKAYRVALLGGEGGDDLDAAVLAGADTYISGRIGYHKMTDAPELGINLIEAGHFYTEYPVCETLVKMISEIDADISAEIYYSNKIAAV